MRQGGKARSVTFEGRISSLLENGALPVELETKATREHEMLKARMASPVMIVNDAMKAMQALAKASEHGGVPATTSLLVVLRASQINGCSVCVDMHSRELKRAGESDERIFAVGAWRD